MKTNLLLLLTFVITLSSNAQFDSIATKLNNHNRKMLNEQVYIHTDRDVYYLGDTIWFKAYIRKKMFLNESNLSKELFVRLVNEKGEVPINEKLFIKDSEGIGQIIIDKTIDEGNYYLIAFTSWMENFEITKVYSKKIIVKIGALKQYKLEPNYSKSIYFPGDTVKMRFHCFDNFHWNITDFNYKYSVVSNNKTVTNNNSGNQELEFVLGANANINPNIKVKAKYKDQTIDTIIELPFSNKLEMSFFPEGGKSINGLLNKIAFKAEYSNGAPANINGYVVNELNEKVVDASAEYNGMGSFIYMPEINKKHFFVAQLINGTNQRFELPIGINDGWQLKSNFQKNNKIIVEINKTMDDTTDALLTLKVRDFVVYFKLFQISQNKQLVVNTDSLPSGIGVITIFDNNLQPQAERLIFINHHDAAKIQMEYSKPAYATRDSVKIKFKLTNKKGNPLTGKFSVSVFDNKQGTTELIDEPNIVTSNYLISEIKGKIEHPNYYFSSDSFKVRHHLDLLLLTQGWRCYNYLTASDSLPKPQNQEYIKGQLMRFKFGKGLVPIKGNITLSNFLNSTKFTTNDTGYFSVRPIYEQGANTNLILSSTDMKGKNNVSLCISPNPFDDKLTKYFKTNANDFNRFIKNPIYSYQTFPSSDSVNMKNNIWIEEVYVNAKKIDKNKDPMYSIVNAISSKKLKSFQLKSANDLPEILSLANLNVFYEINEKGEETQMVNYMGDKVQIGFYVNGYEEKFNTVSTISPENLKELFVLKGDFVQKIYGCFIVVVLYTENNDYYTNDPFPPNIFYTKSFLVAKEFYSPKYNTIIPLGETDLRRTLYWSPKLDVDQNGEATIKFYTSDNNSKMKCVIEGFTNNNEPLHAESYFEVIRSKE